MIGLGTIINVVAIIEREPGTSPSAKDLVEIVDIINELHEENKNLKDFTQHNYSETKKIINNLQKENEQLKKENKELKN